MFYWLCIVVPSGGCSVGFSPELVAWWARGFVRAGWAAVGYLLANGCRVRISTRRFLCWTLKKSNWFSGLNVALISIRCGLKSQRASSSLWSFVFLFFLHIH
ncbi:hypothetical protein Hanom_Chr02g00158661 [Helianthus anomalus]